MDNEKDLIDMDDPDATPGVIIKSANVSALEVTDDDMRKINKYTLKPLKAEDVFVFKVMMADNADDDRNNMPFDAKAIQDLKKIYPGKPMIKDHARRADNQIARVYDTEVVNTNKVNASGEVISELHGKVYMLRTESNKDLIAEIEAGIKREVSTSTKPEKMICNICGVDNMEKYCRHWPGSKYLIEDGTPGGSRKLCKLLLSGAKEAYELSFVPVPAQPRAGAHKCVGFAKPVKAENDLFDNDKTLNCPGAQPGILINCPDAQVGILITEKTKEEREMDERYLDARVKMAESFFYAESEECKDE